MNRNSIDKRRIKRDGKLASAKHFPNDIIVINTQKNGKGRIEEVNGFFKVFERNKNLSVNFNKLYIEKLKEKYKLCSYHEYDTFESIRDEEMQRLIRKIKFNDWIREINQGVIHLTQYDRYEIGTSTSIIYKIYKITNIFFNNLHEEFKSQENHKSVENEIEKDLKGKIKYIISKKSPLAGSLDIKIIEYIEKLNKIIIENKKGLN